jgi:dihydroneopterin aldolase
MTLTDKITIEDLEVHFRVGVSDHERSQPQRLLVTVELYLDSRAAAETDQLRDTVDYFAVSRRVLALGEGRTWQLIEKLASDVARLVMVEFHVRQVRVKVKKFIVPETRYVSVEIERTVSD